jgi:hypothetical protein
MGKHRSEQDDLTYGRHAAGKARGISVAELLERAIHDGRPLWLDWPGYEPNDLVHDAGIQRRPDTPIWLQKKHER